MALPTSHIAPHEQHYLSPEPQWYVVYCQPLRERYTAQNLRYQLGLTVYLPEVFHYSQGVRKEVPFFPRYLFVKADLTATALSRINATEGVSRLVAFGDVPLPVPNEVIHEIHERIVMLNRKGDFIEHDFKSGEVVEIVSRLQHGIEAIFLGPVEPSARVWVLIEILGRMQNIEIDISEVAKLDREESEHGNGIDLPRYQRRTRGKGRKIHCNP